MEPIHYLRAFRRRWWVVVAAVLIAEAVAWFTVPNEAGSSAAPSDTSYSATTIVWNTGASTSGQQLPITSLDALVTVATLPTVAEIAADRLHYDGKPSTLASQVNATVDDNHFFLSIKATAADPKRAVAISTAFSRALIRYLQQLSVKSNDEQQANLQEQIDTLQHDHADPILIEPLKTKLSQLAVDRSAPVPISILQPAAAAPVAPPAEAAGFHAPTSRTSRLLLAGLIGLLAGLVLVLVMERFDSKLRTRRAAEEALGLPVLAEVPAIPRRRRKRVVTATHPISRAADAFRLLSVGISRWSFNSNGRANGNGHAIVPESVAPTKTILVTSPETRDGKTTVAANLAAAYAETGKRVLVVSCNFRRSTLNKLFHVPDGPGLTGLLAAMDEEQERGSFDLSPYVEPCSVVRIAVLPSGATPNRPAELLGSKEMLRFLELVKKQADVVVLDGASMQVASDIAPLLPHVDAVVLVTRAGKTGIELAASTKNLLERLGANVVGIVLNDAKEFSIPVARRGLYRRTRQMAKANGDAVRTSEAIDGDKSDMWVGSG